MILGDGRGLGHRSDPPCTQHPNMGVNAFRRMAGTPRAFFLLRGRQPLRFRRLVGLLRSRSYRARNPVDGLCLGHAPGPAPCFCVDGSRGGGTKNRSV